MITWVLTRSHKLVIVAAMMCMVAFGQVPCNPRIVPRVPVQVTMYVPAQNAAASSTIPYKMVVQQVPLPVASNRFLVIDSISIKGTHPGNSYLAIELRTTVVVPARPTDWVRHFIYSKQSQGDSEALHLRESLNILTAPETPVYIGIQSTSGAPISQMDVTLTGYSIDACRWGQ